MACSPRREDSLAGACTRGYASPAHVGACTHACKHTRTHTHTRSHIRTRARARTHLRARVHAHAHTRARACTRTTPFPHACTHRPLPLFVIFSDLYIEHRVGVDLDTMCLAEVLCESLLVREFGVGERLDKLGVIGIPGTQTATSDRTGPCGRQIGLTAVSGDYGTRRLRSYKSTTHSSPIVWNSRLLNAPLHLRSHRRGVIPFVLFWNLCGSCS